MDVYSARDHIQMNVSEGKKVVLKKKKFATA